MIARKNRGLAKLEIERLYLIPTLSRALDVLELLGQSNCTLAPEELYRQSKISKTNLYRILKTLVHRGYLTQNESGQYRLDPVSPRRLRFGLAALGGADPFSAVVAASITSAAKASGVDLLQLGDSHDPNGARRNAEEFVRQGVDLVLQYQVDEHLGPHVSHIFKNAGIPQVAIDVPHPHATYFGVDNFEVGHEAGLLLGRHAASVWKGRVDWVLGVGFSQGDSSVQSRIAGAFAGIRLGLGQIPSDRFLRLEGRGMRQPSFVVASQFLRTHSKRQRILVAASTDSSALGVLDAVRQAGREQDFAIAGQDCISEVLDEMRSGSSAIIGSISHSAETYGPRLIQLGIALLRGHIVPPYNYVRHHAVTPETLRTLHERSTKRKGGRSGETITV